MPDHFKIEKGKVIFSIFEILICVAVVEVTDPEVRKITVEDIVGSFMSQIKKCAATQPGVKFVLVQPMLIPKLQWYTEGHKSLCKLFRETEW